MAGRAVLLTALAACSSPRGSHLYPAGSELDDGYGDLAQSSAQILLEDGRDAGLPPMPRDPAPAGDPYGGDPYGGDPDAGADLPPAQPAAADVPTQRYTIATGLTGAIEGTVIWRGPPPAAVTTPCGAIEHPGLRVTAGRAASGVLVTINRVERGRALPSLGRPAQVGGVIAKRGCELAPALQIVTPLPANLVIHGDATGVELRVTSPDRAPQPLALAPAGRVVLGAQPGVTRVEADDGSLAAAWVVAASTPYYAITDEAGRYRLDELAAGSYELTFWWPPRADVVDGRLVYGPLVTTQRKVKVTAARPARLDVALGR